VPSKFTIEYSAIRDTVVCDDLEIKILSAVVEDIDNEDARGLGGKVEWLYVIVEADLKNISNKTLSAARFIESPIGIKYSDYRTNEGEFDRQKLKSLKPGENINVKLKYSIHKLDYENNKEIYMYLPNKLYDKQLMNKFTTGTRYGKAIKILIGGE